MPKKPDLRDRVDYHKQHYQKHKEGYKARALKYYWDNYEEEREKRRKRSMVIHRRLRNELLDLLGRECVQCGFNNVLALHFDHIEGNGNKHRKLFNNPIHYYQGLLKEPSLVQVLCANCNTIKKYEKSEHIKS